MAVKAQNLITTQAELEKAVTGLSERPLLAVDTETTGLDPLRDELLLFQIGDDMDQFVIDCRRVDLGPLKPLLTGPTPKVLHNAKFDYKFIAARTGIRLENMIDTMLVEKILYNGLPSPGYALGNLSLRYLNEELPKEERLTFENHSGRFTNSQIQYAKRDVDTTYRILLKQFPRVEPEGLGRTVKLECGAVAAFGDMELAGVFVDQKRWRKVLAVSLARRDELKKELDEIFSAFADRDLFGQVLINYDSEEQVKDSLKRIKIELPDASERSLRIYDHPATRALLAYREHQKVVSTYGESFLEHIHPADGRIHPSFFQLGAESGRVSCRDPNLQNIKSGSEFRECFTAPPGRSIVTADYGGCELRIIAEASQDPVFLKTFREGGDLHSIVASAMFKTTVSKDERPELRKVAKAINFGLAYGMGAQGLAGQIGSSLAEAEQLVDKYFTTYKRIKRYLERSADRALREGYSETFLGRRRYYLKPDDPDSPEGRRQLGRIRRQAKNTPIQGTNADMIKLALIRLRKEFAEQKLAATTVNTVHDEIVVECDKGIAEKVGELVSATMIRAGEQFIRSVPVEVDCQVGDHWSK